MLLASMHALSYCLANCGYYRQTSPDLTAALSIQLTNYGLLLGQCEVNASGLQTDYDNLIGCGAVWGESREGVTSPVITIEAVEVNTSLVYALNQTQCPVIFFVPYDGCPTFISDDTCLDATVPIVQCR